jgi:molybdopterin converting factor small subunit
MTEVHQITIRLAEPYWRSAGQRDLQLEMPAGSLIQDLLDVLFSRYPSLEKEMDGAPPVIFIAETEAKLDSKLEDGNRVYFVWPIAGGSNVIRS